MFKFLRKTKLYVLALPLLLWTLGAGLNQIAINANHDSMPVLYNAGHIEEFIDKEHGYPVQSQGVWLTDDRHSVLTEDSRFYLLCDIIDFGAVKYSIGDVFLYSANDLEPYIGYVWGLALYAALRKKEDEA